MAVPSIEQASATINGVIVQCSHITCPDEANFRMENVLDNAVLSDGIFTWQTVAKASEAKTITVRVGNVEANFNLTTDWTRFVQPYTSVDPSISRDVNIYFPAGEYWLYHTMLEKGNKVSDWSPSPDDTEDQLREVYTVIQEQYTQIMEDTDAIVMQAVSNYVKISDFETFKVSNEADFAITAREISSKVSQTDYNGNTINSLINQDATTVKIQASKVEIDGDVVMKNDLVDGITQISGSNIKTGTINANVVDVINLNADEIKSGKVLAAYIDVEHINIDSAQIASGTINAAHIPDLSAEKITTGELNGQHVTINHIDASNIDAGTINANLIAANSISVSQLTGSIRDDDAQNPTWTINLDTGYMTVGNLAAENITSGYIAAERINSGTITADKLSANSVTTDKIQSNAVTADKIEVNAITASKIKAGEITLDKLTAGAKSNIATSSYSETEYYLSTSDSSATGGNWSTTVPTWASGKYIWTREKTVVSYADGTTSSTTYRPSQNGSYDKNLTNALSTASGAQTSANSASKKEQLIYCSKASGTSSLNAPTSWITDTTGGQNKWTTRRPEYNSSYPVLFIATQRQFVDNSVTCTTPVIDQTTTVIDGGRIITGSVTATQIAANTISVSKLTGSISNGNWVIDLDDGTFSIGSISANKITAGEISAAVTATDFTMKGGKFQVDAGSNSTNYIYLKESTGNKRELNITAGGINFSNANNNYVLIDATAGLYLRDSGGLKTASISPGGVAEFKTIKATTLATLPSTTATSLTVNGVSVTGAADAYSNRLSRMFGNSDDSSSDTVRLPSGANVRIYNKTLSKLLSDTLDSAETYADQYAQTKSSGTKTSSTGRPSGVSSWNIKYKRYGDLCVVAFWITATEALSSTNGNGTPSLPAPIDVGTTDYKYQWYGTISTGANVSGYAYVGSGGSLNFRTNAAGTFYGTITYPVA